MTFDVECPSCGATVDGTDITKSGDGPPVTVARRSTAFDGSVTTLTPMDTFAYMVELPCGCDVLTVN